MKVVIMGCSRVGAYLASELVSKGHSVTVVDLEASALEYARGHYGLPIQCEALVGDARDSGTLKALTAGADAFVATTKHDNSNLMAVQMARLFGVTNVVSRLQDPDRGEAIKDEGIHTVVWSKFQVAAIEKFLLS